MRVMAIVKATSESEAGVMPSERLLTEMGRYNEELIRAGVLLAGEGLHPSSRGARVRLSPDASPNVTAGPFAATSELVAGFWLLQVKSLDDAIAWIRRMPNPDGGTCEVEIRPVFEADDFGAELTPDLREQEARLRTQVAANS